MFDIDRRKFLALAAVGIVEGSKSDCLRAAENTSVARWPSLPAVPYGAVYFRKTAPPPEDWERDYGQAAKDGMNAFRHWFMWSAIEVAPGKYDWS